MRNDGEKNDLLMRTGSIIVSFIVEVSLIVRIITASNSTGTFNQRHAAIICQRTGRSYWQLNDLNVEEQVSRLHLMLLHNAFNIVELEL